MIACLLVVLTAAHDAGFRFADEPRARDFAAPGDACLDGPRGVDLPPLAPCRVEARLGDRLAVTLDPNQGLVPHVLFAKTGGRWSAVAELDYEIDGAKSRTQRWKPLAIRTRRVAGHVVYEVRGERSVVHFDANDGRTVVARFTTATLTLCAADSESAPVHCLERPILERVAGPSANARATYRVGDDGVVTITPATLGGAHADEAGYGGAERGDVRLFY